MRPLGDAVVRGHLYQLDGYPGLALDAAGKFIRGRVYELPSGKDQAEAAIAQLDRYEEFDSERPASSLFRRVLCRPHLAGGKRSLAWIYVYNRPIDAMQPLKVARWSPTVAAS
jgi:gamma-glutamylcyclotransferase (GGCT)/AIG2-like uncharacterized protein YtfP